MTIEGAKIKVRGRLKPTRNEKSDKEKKTGARKKNKKKHSKTIFIFCNVALLLDVLLHVDSL